jgi:hypothetical protein
MAIRTKNNWITTPVTADFLRGALDLQQTAQGVLPHRLPVWARAQCADGQLAMAEAQPSAYGWLSAPGPPPSN